MGGSSSREAAREVVMAYHGASLRDLLVPVGAAMAELDAGRIGPFEVDAVIFQYSRAAKELWKYCNLGDVHALAQEISAGHAPAEWWSRGAFRRR